MFQKTSKTASGGPERAAPPPLDPLPDMPGSRIPGRSLSTLSADLTLEGQIAGAGDLHIDGTVRGDVRVNRLVIGETGVVEGAVHADHVELRGRVIGSIQAKQVKLVASAHLEGDIITEQLAIDSGAVFQGRVSQSARPTPALIDGPRPTPVEAL